MDQKQTTILIVDDDKDTRDVLEAILQKNHTVLKCNNGKSALQRIAEEDIHIVLLDILLPDYSGIDVLKQIKDRYSDIEVMMVSGVKEVNTAVQALQLGAYHYLTKPFNYSEVQTLVEKVVERQRDTRELLYLRSEIKHLVEADFISGRSKKMCEIRDLAKKVARLPVTVLIQGESGTGKQILAGYIHKEGNQENAPFVTADLGALSETLAESTLFGHEKGAFTGAYRQHIGKFEIANGGTLFLDEIGNLRYELQGKLLRAIQEGEIERVGGTKTIRVHVRLIAATNIDLADAVRKGVFREDLYYRLNVIPIKLPPLRERLGDIPKLIEHFLRRYNKRFNKNIQQISQPAMEVLSSSYDWPGNIRELENLIVRMVAIIDGDTILKEHIPLEYHLATNIEQEPKEGLLEKALEIFEQNFILRALEKEKWNRRATAQALGIPLSTLKYKIKKLKLLGSRQSTGKIA